MDADFTVFELIDCHFTYRQHRCLREITTRLRQGLMYGLIGPNGSGKTTLLSLLTGNMAPTAGQVLLQQRRVNTIPKLELAKKLAYVPQTAALDFEYTVEEIVMMGRHPYIGRFGSATAADHEKVEDALRALDILYLRDRYVTRLSGGERQRVVVARALAQDTPILILDEATASLDVRHSIEIMQTLRKRLATSATTVIAAIHDLDLASAFCDELLVLADGKLVASGPVDHLLTPQLMREVFSVEATIHHQHGHPPQISYRYDHR